jgi:orotidine-5'-phosphate decarboxylase
MNSHSATVANRIIVALDVPTKKAAIDLVRQLAEDISFFKVGLQLYAAEGPAVVREILASGAKVFLDLKLYDIPNTVAGAVRSAAELGVHMLSIHLSGGDAMVRAAISARNDNLTVLGVTVLTSMTQETLSEVGIVDKVDNQVSRLAKLGVAAGINGLVASPHEIEILRPQFGDEIKIVTPGIRPSWMDAGDQKRVMTPREALDAGADYLVIGRPIITHSSPSDAVQRILKELSA